LFAERAKKKRGSLCSHSLTASLQEIALEGQDKAFKDVIEPLESVSLSIAPTARASLAEAGTPEEVATALVNKSARPGTQVALVSATQARLPLAVR